MSDNHLFHGTGIYCLTSIVASGELWEGIHWGKPDEPHGPRTTEDFEKACEFIENSMYWGEGGVIVLDRELLARDYPLVSYTDRSYLGEIWPGRSEREIAIITPKLVDLDKYLVSIIVDEEAIEQALLDENIEAAMCEGGWAYESGEAADVGIALFRQEVEILKAHPKLNLLPPPVGGLPWRGNWQRAVDAPRMAVAG